MIYLVPAIIEKLHSSDYLLARLGENKNPNDKGEDSAVNSVIPVEYLSNKFKGHFVTIDISAVASLGRSRDCQVLIRVYSDRSGGYDLRMREISEDIRNILNHVILDYDLSGHKSCYELIFVSAFPQRFDEGVGLQYCELEFKALIP